MKEIELLSAKDKNELLRLLEEQCGLLLPKDKALFGAITFHLFRGQRQQGLHFLIRWGLQKIFSARGIHDAGAARVLEQLRSLIRSNKTTIKKALTDYCGEQLNNMAQIELQPELTRQCSDARQLSLSVCQARACRSKETNNHGWPNYCVVISWLDETDEFQEFLFPLAMEEQSRSFTIPGEAIIARFRRYRDTLI